MPLTVPGRFARATSLAAAVCVAALGSARAEPLRLAGEGDLDRFAELVTAYKDTSRGRWVVEARDAADRSRIMSGLAERLGPAR
ncbi:MAG TPA: hypothetical protein VMP03_00630, partial [Methylomirabilota bacterium]|nr:hypothetical protein [Methylomirabilota bacterium]